MTGKRKVSEKKDKGKGKRSKSSPVLKLNAMTQSPLTFHKKREEIVQCPACNESIAAKNLNAHLDKDCQSRVGIDSCISVQQPSLEKKKIDYDVIEIEDDGEDGTCSLLLQCENSCKATSNNYVDKFDDIVKSLLLKESSAIDNELLEFRKTFNPFRERNHLPKEESEGKNQCCNAKMDLTIPKSSQKPFDDINLNMLDSDDSLGSFSNEISDLNNTLSVDGDFGVNTKSVLKKEDADHVTTRNDSNNSDIGNDIKDEVKPKEYEPYYLENFKFVIESVLNDISNKDLFNEEDMRVVENFKLLSDKAKQLYVRLFLRKFSWFKVERIKYPRISEDLNKVISELIKQDFLDDKNSLEEINEILNLMSAPEVRSLAKFYHLFKDQIGRKLSTKEEMVAAIIQHSNNQKSVKSYFMKASQIQNSMKVGIIKKSKSLLGDCVKVSRIPREIFCRFFCLFSYMNHYLDDDENEKSNLIYKILQIKKGELVFPSYEITKSTLVFKTRHDVIRYTDAAQIDEEFAIAMEEKDFDKALEVCQSAREEVDELSLKLESKDCELWSSQLPIQLRRFSREWTLFRLCSKSVEALEKKGRYEEAVVLLKLILQQTKYCLRSRGLLWERLAIDTERYLKDPSKALDYIKTALSDPWVRVGIRLGLINRAKRICTAVKNKHLKERMCEFQAEQLDDVNEITISAPVFLDTSSSNRTIFLVNVEDSSDRENQSQAYSAVEEFALSHYREKGYPNGVHGEGSPYTLIFSLLFWEIIFMDVTDVFLGPYQACPLDFRIDQFYEKRREHIDKRLEEIRNSSKEDLRLSIKESWYKHEGQVCIGCNWTLLEDDEQAMDVVSCLNGETIAGICELFCKDFKNRSSGMPDLLVWNAATQKCKAVEVKGPGDRLSNKQIIWLNVLTSLGMDAEVCYVRGVGGKRRRLSKD